MNTRKVNYLNKSIKTVNQKTKRKQHMNPYVKVIKHTKRSHTKRSHTKRKHTKRKHTKRKHSGGIDGPIVLLKPVRETFRTLFDKTPKKGYYIPYYVGINDYLEKSSVDDLNKDLYSKDLAKFQDKRDRVWNEFTVSINLLEYMRHLAIYLQRKQYIIQCTLFFCTWRGNRLGGHL